MSFISNDSTFVSGAANCSAGSSEILGLSTFCDTSKNYGLITSGVFFDNSINSGIVDIATFYNNSTNAGTVNISGIFHDSSSNESVVEGDAIFDASATNNGSVVGTNVNRWYGDDSSAHHTVTLNGSVTQVNEVSGVKVASFDGSGYLTSPASADFNLTGDFTIEFFVYANDANDYWELIQLGDGITTGRYSGWGIRKETAGNNSRFAFSRHTESGGWELNLLYSITPIANEWLHVAVTRDSSAGVRFFVNGTQLTSVIEDQGSVEASKTISFTNPNNAADMPLTIGSAYFGDPNTIKYFNGRIAGLRIIKGAALYTSSFSVPTTLPTAVSGTQLLLNFGATAVPAVVLNDTFTDASIDGSYNITPYSYTTHAGRFYVGGVPYTGTHTVTDYHIVDNGYGPEGYTTTTRDVWFVVGTEVNVSGSLPSVSYADGVYTITGSVDINSRNLTSLNFADCIVTGNFSCGSNQLTSLQGAPSSVGGNFDCYSNQLTSLQHAPATVGGNFECFSNQLTSLQYAPTTVGGDFNCYSNQLTSLQGVPSSVGNFNCYNNLLTSLQYAPTTVSGGFNCDNNLLTSLQYAPTTVSGNFSCKNNQLTSLQYAPSSVGSYFDCRDNLLTSLQYAPADNSSLTRYVLCSNNQFSFPIISQDIDNVYWEYASDYTRKLATNHHYIHSSYYADVATLVNGTVVYTASDSNSTANNVTFYTVTNTITTNGSGVVTLSALPWYADTSSAAAAVTFHSGVTQSDLGSGVKAASFDGSTGYLELLHTPAYGAGTGDFTFEFFAKTNANSNATWSAYEASVGAFAANTMGINVYNNGVSYYSERAGGVRFSNATPVGGNLTDNAWHHVAIVRSNGNVLKKYIDGQLVATQTDASNMYTASDSEMRFGYNTHRTEDGYWSGMLAGVRVSHSARYSGNRFTVPTAAFAADSSTKLLLNFGATAMPTVAVPWYIDASDAQHVVTRNGSVTQSDEGGGVKAVLFDTTNYLSVASNTGFTFGTGEFTIEFFAKPTESNVAHYSCWITTCYPNDTTGVFLSWGASGEPNVIGRSDAESVTYVFDKGNTNNNSWNHIAFVRSGNTYKYFVNGQLIDSLQTSDNLTNSNGQILIGGRPQYTQLFNGKIAGLRIVKGSALYTSDFTVPTSLPTAVSGTQLLLNFGATAAPSV